MLLYALTMGSTTNGPDSFLRNVQSADGSNIGWALFAGVIFNLANLLLVAAIDMAGLSIAFPVAIGIALVVGVVLSYAQQRQGNLTLLTAGVLCAVVAVIFDGLRLRRTESRRTRPVSRKSIIICVISGVLMGLWAPFSTRALTHGNPLGPYSVAVFSHARRAAFELYLEYLFHEASAGRRTVAFSGLFRGPVSRPRARTDRRRDLGHWHRFQSGGRASHRVAISYAIGQSAPMVAALWGILVWKNSPAPTKKPKPTSR